MTATLTAPNIPPLVPGARVSVYGDLEHKRFWGHGEVLKTNVPYKGQDPAPYAIVQLDRTPEQVEAGIDGVVTRSFLRLGDPDLE